MDSRHPFPGLNQASPVPSVPAWAMRRGPIAGEAHTAFAAGAAMASLDTLVRSRPAWGGAWRQRLALKCAAAATKLAGRTEDEAALRDAALLTRPGDDSGPAGRILLAWQELAWNRPVVRTEELHRATALLGIGWSDELAELPAVADALVREQLPAPVAAAEIIAHVLARAPAAELLAWWLADVLVANAIGWEKPVPLLMAQRYGTPFRTDAGRGRLKPNDPGFERAICAALVQGAADALRVAADIARRADRLAAVAPKLRAKGASDAIARLLEDDAVSGSLATSKLSRFASRRLFARLVELEAVRELSGRPTFRLYGL